jgi:hypothetical protein
MRDRVFGRPSRELLHLRKDHPADVEVQPHPNSIAGHEHIVPRVGVVEELGLLAPRLGGERSVDDAALVVALGLDLLLKEG